MDILEIKNVTYNYSNSNEKVLYSVNQKFEIGKFYAIIGKSGAGKSTLLSLDRNSTRLNSSHVAISYAVFCLKKKKKNKKI